MESDLILFINEPLPALGSIIMSLLLIIIYFFNSCKQVSTVVILYSIYLLYFFLNQQFVAYILNIIYIIFYINLKNITKKNALFLGFFIFFSTHHHSVHITPDLLLAVRCLLLGRLLGVCGGLLLGLLFLLCLTVLLL